jgi:hypothetical protein
MEAAVAHDEFQTLLAGSFESDGDYVIRGELYHEGDMVADLTEREGGVTIRMYPKPDRPWWECDLAALLRTLTELQSRLVSRADNDA